MTSGIGVPLEKQQGFVTTPPSLARELVNWAVRHSAERVLDLGVGEGVFATEAARRLVALGARPQGLTDQIFGVEKSVDRYAVATRRLREEFKVEFSGLRHGDLFEQDIPPVSAVVGNPPYVRRASLEDVERIHQRVLHHNVLLGRLPRLTDLYAYFLFYVEPFIPRGARLAVVLSSSWLDTRSGVYLKRFLLDRFRIHAVVACDVRMFKDTLVRSVLLIAEKGTAAPADAVSFVRLNKFVPGVLDAVDKGSLPGNQGTAYQIHQRSLEDGEPWSVYLRNPVVYAHIRSGMTARVRDVATTRIGIQPLARDFYVLTPQRREALGIDRDLVLPMVYSPRHVEGAIAEPDQDPGRWILAVQGRDARTNAALRAYIEWAETVTVAIRGKNRSVVGYHNVPRLQQAGRDPWFSLAGEIERRGVYPILIPRRFYERFTVVWNKAGAVPGENFIEARPRDASDLFPLLAILNSSYFEFVARCHAQQYGGGVNNLNPVDVRQLPTSPIPRVGQPRSVLTNAFKRFARSPDERGRLALDEAVGGLLGYTGADRALVWDGVMDLRELSVSSKRSF